MQKKVTRVRVFSSLTLDIRLAPATRDFLVPAILSPAGRAAGYALELVAGSRARLRQVAQDDAEAADFFDDDDFDDEHFDDYGLEM